MKKKTGSTAFMRGSEKSEESFAVAVTTKANMQKQRQARTIKFLNFPIFGAEKAETSKPFSPAELLIIQFQNQLDSNNSNSGCQVEI